MTSWFVLVFPQKHYFPINYRVSVPYEGVLRMANITRLVRIPSWAGRPLPCGTPHGPSLRGTLILAGHVARGLSQPRKQACPWLGLRFLPVHSGCPWSALFVGTSWVAGGQSSGGEGPEAQVLGLQQFLLSPQQRAQVSQQELRYLWVWVSLSATESVQEVLLEGHPSWKFLEEVHTLLLDVQQGLTVSSAEVCVCVCGGQGVLREDGKTWRVPACPERYGRNGREEEKASSALWVAWAGDRRCSSVCLSCSVILDKSLNPLALFLEVPFGGDREGRMNGWSNENRFLGLCSSSV